MTNKEAIERLTYIKEHQIDPEDYEVIDFVIKALSKKKTASAFVKPTLEEIQDYINEQNYNVDAEYFFDHYEANGWYVGSKKMSDWKATLRNWNRRDMNRPAPYTPQNKSQPTADELFGEVDPETEKIINELLGGGL